MTRSPSRLVGLLRLLSRLRCTRFHGCGLSDRRTWREGVLSLKHRGCNETKKYHPAQQSPRENDWLPGNKNPHGRTSGDEQRLTIAAIILRKSQSFHEHLASVSSLRLSCQSNRVRSLDLIQLTRVGYRVHSGPSWRRPIK
jgi:hypothetical protein